jgi:PAS domain S-box-containing protein
MIARLTEELAEARQANEDLMRTADAMVVGLDAEGRLLLMNQAAERITGYTLEELRGRSWFETIVPRDRFPQVWEEFRRLLRGGLPKSFENPILTRQGEERFIAWSNTEVARGGRITGTLSFGIDITERRRALEQLRTSEEKFRKVFEASPDAINVNRLSDGMYVSINEGFTAITGYTAADVAGRTSLALSLWVDPHDRERLVESLRRNGEVRNLEARFRAKDGSLRQGQMSAAIVEIGGVPHIVSVTRDVTESRLAEEQLRESERRFRDLAESLPLPVFEMDLQGRFTYVNHAALEAFGYTAEEVAAGLNVFQMIAPGDRERTRANFARRVAGEPESYQEYRGLRKDGGEFAFTVAVGPILREGRVAGLRGIVSDLTVRRQLEEERLKAQKLESLGTLAGGIAHDFNNLLQAVFGGVSMAKLSLEDPARARALLEQAEKALQQSVSLTSQLLTFAKGGQPVRRPVDLRQLVGEAARLVLSGSRAECDLRIDADLWAVEADEGQIAQVVQNLVLNADQAMPGGGRITIRARNLPATGPAAGGHVEIVVRDEGAGIPPGDLPRIFDPYFTTKEKGSGLGLASVYSIVRNHGGTITAASVPGEGAAFTVTLPASGGTPAAGPGKEEPARPRRGRILLMDDEELVRRVAGDMLRQIGHEVVLAARGEDALARYREALSAGRPFDAVVLDLTVRGGLGGLETLRGLQEMDPGVKAVVSSGYSDDDALAEHRRRGFRGFLKKPYTIRALSATLDALLA